MNKHVSKNVACRLSSAIGCLVTLSKVFLSLGLTQALNIADIQKGWMGTKMGLTFSCCEELCPSLLQVLVRISTEQGEHTQCKDHRAINLTGTLPSPFLTVPLGCAALPTSSHTTQALAFLSSRAPLRPVLLSQPGLLSLPLGRDHCWLPSAALAASDPTLLSTTTVPPSPAPAGPAPCCSHSFLGGPQHVPPHPHPQCDPRLLWGPSTWTLWVACWGSPTLRLLSLQCLWPWSSWLLRNPASCLTVTWLRTWTRNQGSSLGGVGEDESLSSGEKEVTPGKWQQHPKVLRKSLPPLVHRLEDLPGSCPHPQLSPRQH